MKKKRIAKTISVPQLYRRFPDDAACREWFEQVLWNSQPVCPHCGSVDEIRPPSDSKPNHYWCKSCRKHFTVTTGTCLHSSPLPLQHWIYAIYSILTGRKGISAMQLSKELGVQYRTAWHMLHRVREASKSGDFKLANVVEVDETYVGGKERNKHETKKRKAGRGTAGKTPIIGARERGGKVAAEPVSATDARTFINFVEAHTEQGATVYTDDAGAYTALPTILNQYQHESVKHSAGEYVRGEIHTNGIESVWSVFKRSVIGTWHHVSNKHLGRYVNEAAFRLNEGNCEVDTIDRMAALAKGIRGRKLSYKALIA